MSFISHQIVQCIKKKKKGLTGRRLQAHPREGRAGMGGMAGRVWRSLLREEPEEDYEIPEQIPRTKGTADSSTCGGW